MSSLDELLAGYDAAAPLEEASTIPGAWYTDPRVAELERRTVFSRSWQPVARAAQLARPGDFVTAEVAGEPLLLARGHDGTLRGFFNVCRHHAAAVMTEPCGHAERFVCPYHGWTYALDGRLRSAPELDGARGFDLERHGLHPVAVEVWHHHVYAHLDPDPPPIARFAAGMAEQLAALELDTLCFAGRREWELACNWKVFVDNYLDGGYHVPYLHRGLNSVLSFKDYSIECGERFCLQSSPTSARGADASTAAVRKGHARYYWLYPNVMLNHYQGYLDLNVVQPLAVDRTRVIFEFFFADVSEAAAEANRASMAVSARIQDEDLAICESVQRGLGSRAYGAGRLSPRREAGEQLFHRLLAADLRRGAWRGASRGP